MKLYEEKRELLLDLTKKYLSTIEDFETSMDDGIIITTGFDGNSFLMFLALTYSKEEFPSIYSIDFDIDDNIKSSFVNNEYHKIISSSKDDVQKGKIILDDSKKYYNENYSHSDIVGIDDAAKTLRDKGIKI